MKSEFKFEKGDIVRIVDKWSGFADPAEYKVHDYFTTSDFSLFGGTITMYEVETGGRHALIQESMLELIRSVAKEPTQGELLDLFEHMDKSAQEAMIDRLLEQRMELMGDMKMATQIGQGGSVQAAIDEIDAQLAKYSEGAMI